jgi:hypothetical protein
MNRNSNTTFLLLLDGAAAPGNSIQTWLTEKGLVAWAANDVGHAIEELSDYTVAKRPDVVMLEVAMLMETYDTLKSAFEPDGADSDVTVVALGNRKTKHTPDPYFADDLDALKSLICGRSRL